MEAGDLQFWLRIAQIAAIPIGACIGAIVAIIGVRKTLAGNLERTQKTQAINFVLARHQDGQYTKSVDVVISAKERGLAIAGYADQKMRTDEISSSIRYILNSHEYMAVAVNNGIFHEQMLYESSRTSTVRIFKYLYPYIHVNREQTNKTAFVEFEKLARRW
ncbi:MAG: DUF4760 domain-containing protein, partial [Pseudomonadota bacterium]